MYGEFVYGLFRTFSPWVAVPGRGGEVTGVLSPSMMGVRLPSKCSWLRIKKAAEKWFFPLSKTGGGGGDTTSGAEIKEEEPFSACLSEEEKKFNKLQTIEFSLKGECNIFFKK